MLSRWSVVASLIFIVLSASACKKGGDQNQTAAPGGAPQQAVQNPVDPATAGTINGTIKFTGTAPKAQKISMSADAYCMKQHAGTVSSEEVVVNPNKTLKNVYVYVKSGLGDIKFPPAAQPAVLDQKGCMYTPHVLGVQANQEIIVRNSDGVLHNVNARPTKNQGFNFGQPVQGMESKKSFTNPEVMIPIKCDVHPWMSSYIGVQTHPYFSVSGEDGSFSLKNLPPGTYEVEAWHEKFGTQTQTVTIGASETKPIEFTFKGV